MQTTFITAFTDLREKKLMCEVCGKQECKGCGSFKFQTFAPPKPKTKTKTPVVGLGDVGKKLKKADPLSFPVEAAQANIVATEKEQIKRAIALTETKYKVGETISNLLKAGTYKLRDGELQIQETGIMQQDRGMGHKSPPEVAIKVDGEWYRISILLPDVE